MTILPLVGAIIHHTPLTNTARFSFNFPYRELCSPGKSLPPPTLGECRHGAFYDPIPYLSRII
jgi:hypothetical protein